MTLSQTSKTGIAADGAVADLIELASAADPYVDDGRDDHAELRLNAANERFVAQRASIRALDLRAKELGVERFENRADLVPLLFAHSVYKSYPESFIAKGRWKQMSGWLDSVATGDITAVDVTDCTDVDDWLNRLERAGFHLIVSSGTSGKNSFLVLDDDDIALDATTSAHIMGYPHRTPDDERLPITLLGPGGARMRYCYAHRAMGTANGLPGRVRTLSDAPALVGDMLKQTAIRRAMADGTATPSEIGAFQEEQRERGAKVMEQLNEVLAHVLDQRAAPQSVLGPWAMAWRLLEAGQAAGFTESVFHPETIVNVAGGPKGITLPDDYQQQMDRFLGPVKRWKIYSMSEMSQSAPMCERGVYHWPKTIELFVLDETGERLEDVGPDGRVTGRVGVYDPLLSARWGGTITGDKVTVNYNPCPCGRMGPVVEDSIVRYSELSAGGDDKLTCGGSIEQYIRGIEPVESQESTA